MATRFQSLTNSDIRVLIDSLVQQIGSGTASISINGVMTTYSTPANIRLAIAEFEAELVERAMVKAGVQRRSPLAPQYPRLVAGKGY